MLETRGKSRKFNLIETIPGGNGLWVWVSFVVLEPEYQESLQNIADSYFNVEIMETGWSP